MMSANDWPIHHWKYIGHSKEMVLNKHLIHGCKIESKNTDFRRALIKTISKNNDTIP